MLVRIIITLFLLTVGVWAQPKPFVSNVWVADNGDGTYRNPIIFADYSDSDVVRVGEDFYMTASSFNAAPGLPILHSKDLVNWRIVNHVFREQYPTDVFAKPQHGGGAWAPSIRFHAGEYYIYYGDPDFGIYMTKSKDPAGEKPSAGATPTSSRSVHSSLSRSSKTPAAPNLQTKRHPQGLPFFHTNSSYYFPINRIIIFDSCESFVDGAKL